MIDGIRSRRNYTHLRPRERHMVSQMVVSDHSRDHFKPPEEVAAAEEQQGEQGTAANLLPKPPRKKKRSLKDRFQSLSTKQKILLTAGTAVVVAGLGIGTYLLFFTPDKPVPKPVVNNEETPVPPPPTTVASNLTGLQVDPLINERPVTAIMIENSSDARPQAGLHQAGVVFEAIAEGGITRFVTLFQDSEPDYVGPVRSVRPYYLQWALGFDAAVAHAGGSAEALNNIKQWGVKDLNHHASYFWRVSNRAAPHNLYTSITKMREYEAARGFGKANFTPLPRKAAEQPAATPTAKSIDFNISSANFNVHYDYDPASNSYKRKVGGKEHIEEKSGTQLAPKVVVALVMPQGKNHIYTTYQTIGSGQAYIFQDGVVATATWKKDSNNANFTFVDTSGAKVGLNPGQTWFTVLGGTERITYAP